MLDILCAVHAQYTRHYSICCTMCLVFCMLFDKFDILWAMGYSMDLGIAEVAAVLTR